MGTRMKTQVISEDGEVLEIRLKPMTAAEFDLFNQFKVFMETAKNGTFTLIFEPANKLKELIDSAYQTK
jgi:hypothetical protein